MILTQEILDDLLDCAADAYLPEESLRSYSGRFMYGKECLGVVHDSIEQLLSFVVAAAGIGIDLSVGNVRQDNMGLGTITYWPDIKLDDNLMGL